MRLGAGRRRRGRRFPLFLPGCSLWCGARRTDSECGSDIQQDSLLENVHPLSEWEPSATRHAETEDVGGWSGQEAAGASGASAPTLESNRSCLQVPLHATPAQCGGYFPLWTTPYVPPEPEQYNIETISSTHTDTSIQWNLFEDDVSDSRNSAVEEQETTGDFVSSSSDGLSENDETTTDVTLNATSNGNHSDNGVLAGVLFTLDRHLQGVSNQQNRNHELRSRMQRLSRSLSLANHSTSGDSSPASSERSRSSNGGRQLQQNWYIYDPRLVPGNRAQRLTFQTNYGGIANTWSMPGIIEPPPYEEDAGPSSSQDALGGGATSNMVLGESQIKYSAFMYGAGTSSEQKIPKEPPPPYSYAAPPYGDAEYPQLPNNLEGYDEAPPSYREATFDSPYHNPETGEDESSSSLTGISDLIEQASQDYGMSSADSIMSVPLVMNHLAENARTADVNQRHTNNTHNNNDALENNSRGLPVLDHNTDTLRWSYGETEVSDLSDSVGSAGPAEPSLEYYHRGSHITESLPSLPTPPDSPTAGRGPPGSDMLVLGRRPPLRWSRGMGLDRWTSSQVWPF